MLREPLIQFFPLPPGQRQRLWCCGNAVPDGINEFNALVERQFKNFCDKILLHKCRLPLIPEWKKCRMIM